MRQLNLLYILCTLVLFLLAPNLATALLASEAAEIPYQINKSDRIVIGMVSGVQEYYDHTIFTITVDEWLYNPLPAETIKVRTNTGTNVWTEDQAEFTLNESVLIMLRDEDLDKQLFSVFAGFPGKHPISDKEAVINELKAQGKLQGENQTVNTANDTGIAENTETVGKPVENPNQTQKPDSTPFISPIWVLAILLGSVTYARKK